MKKSELAKIIQEAVTTALKARLLEAPVTDDQLDDATQLLMMVTGRVMAAKETPVDGAIIQAAVDQLEQIDGLLSRAGLAAQDSDISQLSESFKKLRENRKS